MWALINRTPYKVGKTWGRDKDGVHEWIVAVKVTFDIRPDGGLKLSDQQTDPLLVPEYNGAEGSSLRYEADLVAPKPTTDVLVNGTAHTPRGRPSAEFLVSIRIARIAKVIRVVGNRRWERGLSGLRPSEPEPIITLPIIYECAYGGYDHTNPDPRKHLMDSRNPVGRGVAANPQDREGQLLANFEYPSGDIAKTGPAGFGAIASYWSPRRELNGTYDDAWEEKRRPLLPLDWDPRSLLCSPADQRPESHLAGGELVELSNLTRDGLLRFALPKLYFTFSTRIDRRFEEHRSRLSTVIIEPDHPRVILVWISSLRCPTDVDYLEETVIREKPYLQ